MLTYHNNPQLKESIVEEMRNHQKNDQIIKSTYGKINGTWKGCAVGCAVHSINIRLGKNYKTDQHKAYEEAIGVPEWLARLHDTIFEGLPEEKNTQFAVDLLEAIPVGVNLDKVKWQFCAFILKENIDRVLSLSINDKLKKQVVKAIQKCLSVHENAITTNVWNKSAAASAARSAAIAAWSAAESAAIAARSAAESAARSAARSAESAAESAARSAASAARSAESAARSAARSAAWSAAIAAWSAAESAESAAYQKYATELLHLLKGAS